MGYRKLSTEELRSFGINTSDKYKQIIDHVKKYYPNTANRALLLLDSEYDDEYYNNKVKTILVFDKEGNELVPTKGKSLEARNIPYIGDLEQTNQYLEDIVVYLDVPELYVKDA
jgi:hypothetical protein